MARESVFDLAHGRWKSVLMQLGIDKKYLKNKHGPCPMCGGTDRFRFDDKEGRGSYYCNQCGPGTPLTMLKKIYGWSPAEVAKKLEQLFGGRRVTKPLPKQPIHDPEADERREKARLDAMRAYWQSCEPLREGCPVREYLRWRGIGPDDLIDDALINVKQRLLGGSFEMVCAVRGPQGGPAGVQLHRTIIDGNFRVLKRLLWRGEFPAGSAVPLFRPMPMLPLGIAEGIETAISAAMLFNNPVWAALNTQRLKTWQPPPKEAYDGIVIYADNDENGAGQLAAEELRRRLWQEGYKVEVQTPPQTGTDWNDILAAQQSRLARDAGHQQ